MPISTVASNDQNLATAIVLDPLVVSPQTTVGEAISLMSQARSLCTQDSADPVNLTHQESRSRCVIVQEDETVVGILTEWDVLRLCTGLGTTSDSQVAPQAFHCTPVRAVMSTPVQILQTGDFTDRFTIVHRVQQHPVRHWPVVDEQGHLVGLVTPDTLRQVEAQIQARRVEWQQHMRREQVITTLATQIRSSWDLQTILETAVAEIRQIIRCDRVNIWKLEPDNAIVVIAESTSLPRSFMGVRVKDDCFRDYLLTMYQADHVRVVSDIYELEMAECHRDLLVSLQIRSKVLLPLLCGGNLWGLLNVVESDTPRNWQPEEITLLQTLATHLTIAIQQASQHKALQTELQERQAIEAELRRGHQRLEEAQHMAKLGNWELDLNTDRLYWSPEIFRIFEVDPQEFSASYETFLNLVHPDDRAEVNKAYQQHLKERHPYDIVHRLCMADGRIKYVYEQCETTYSEDGTPFISRGTVRDITPQKEADLERHRAAQDLAILNAELERRVLERTAELAEREATLADFLKNAHDLIQIVNVDTGRFEFVNSAWQRVLGYTEAELEALTIFDVLAPDCQEQFRTVLNQMQTGAIVDVEQVEFTLMAQSGQAIVVEGNLNCRCQGNGQERPCFVRGILRDITAKKAAEIALQASEAKYRQIVENAHEGIWIIDADANHLFGNEALSLMLGYSSAEMAGRSLFDFFSPELHPHLEELLARRQAGIAETNEVPLLRKDGTILWGLATASPMFNKAGEYLGAMAMITDITQRKQQEEERQHLLQELTGFKLGLDEAAIVAITDNQGVILYTNQRFVDLSGYSEAELIGQTHRLVNSGTHPSSFFQDLWKTVRRGEVWRGEICNRRKDGHLYWVDSTIVPFLNTKGQPDRYLAVRFDITRKKQAELLLEEKLELLRGVTAAQSQFITAQNRLDIFEGLLSTLLEVTNSEYGFIGEVLFRDDGSAYLEESFMKIRGVPYVKTHSITNIAWDEATQKFYEDNYEEGMEFTNMNTLFGAVVMTGKPVIANNPSTDPRRGGTPDGHPPLNAFLGLPFFSGSTLVGMVGVANRPGGYDQHLIEKLHPLLITCSNLIEGYRQDRLRQQAEAALQTSQRSLQRQLTAIEAAVDGIAILQDGCYLYLNSAHCQMFGYESAEELLGQNWQMLYSPDEIDRFGRELFPYLAEHQHWTGQATATRKDGTTFPEQLSLTITEDNLLICVCQDITEQKQAELLIRQQADRETLLRQITQRIRRSLDLQTIFDTACEEIRQVLQADRVGIFKFLPSSQYDDGLFLAESLTAQFPSVLAIPVHDHCFGENYASLYIQGSFFVVNDIYAQGLQPCHQEIYTQLSIRAALVLPLLSGKELWGLLCIHQCTGPRQWKQDEITFTQQLANQLAIGIQQASLLKQTQKEVWERQQAEAKIAQQLRRQRALATLTQLILQQSLNLEQILATVTLQVKEVLNGDRVIIFRLYPDGRSAIVEEAVSEDLPRLRDMTWEDEVWDQEILEHYWQGQPRIVPDVMNDRWTDCLVEYSHLGQIRSKIVAPILQEIVSPENHRWVIPTYPKDASQKLWGILVIHSCKYQRVWQDSEAQLLQQIANQTAIAIQQASLFEQLQTELQERQQTQKLLTQRNEELAISNTELARATRLKDEFLANMSHELRTPLNSILGMNEALQEEVFGIMNEKQLKALRTVEKSASHLLTLINDILDVAKIESGEVKLEYGYVSIEQLCSSSLAFMKQLALQKRIQLHTQIPPHLPAVFVDEVRMRQVLLNLLTNAVKFTLEGGTVTLAVSVVAAPAGGSSANLLRLAIQDTGIGIAAENLDKLFKPFVQIDGALNRQQTGTGLGLTLVKQLVELHGGTVKLTSELGVGSCFTIDLPYISKTSSESALELPLVSTDSPTAESDSLTQAPLILLAEDDPANTATISSYLEAKGYDLIFANDGQEAVNQAQAAHPDLILMDIQMPGMDGLEAIGRIRELDNLQAVPIIALTALAMKGDQERCLAAGANLYLSKPVKLKQLDMAIRDLLQ
jgi:PAS domain S-box-containing protein